jgi:phosphoserine phosphatase RsbU/P
MPKRPEIRVAAALTPARSVGGDLYDFVLDDEGIWFIVGDVSGHGVGAALYMAVTKTLFRATVQSGVSIEEVFARINRELCRDNEQMMFVTAIVGRLEFESGKVQIGDAGHTPVFLVDVRGQMSQPSIPKSIAFGVQEDAAFAVGTFTMTPGSSVLLHTDGATDARNTAGEIFGSDRLQKAMKASAGRTVTELVHGTLGAVNKFAAGAAPEDDLTFLAIEYLGTDATQG